MHYDDIDQEIEFETDLKWYNQGWTAFCQRQPHNPYVFGTRAHNEWSRGYLDSAWDYETYNDFDDEWSDDYCD